MAARRRRDRIVREPIAIVGIGCRFPGGANNPDAFWTLIRDGSDAITEVPPDRWSLSSFYDPDPDKPGRTYARWGGFLDQIDQFDAQFFGISPREATYMDPQQRLLLETTWEALEDGGQPPDKLAGSKTGVFIGISTHDYGDIQMRDVLSTDVYASTGGAPSIAANRISYLLDLRGPSIAVDTACSSSLVAVHLACQSIWNGESSMALAGGVNVLISPEVTIGFSKASMLSHDGHCKTFDARADGYVRGEGAGVLVLRPLAAALADGDRIYAVIRATGVNQDGRTNGITVPNLEAQVEILRQVYGEAGIKPEQVFYVEAHGTGTPVGDPIEANAIGTVLGAPRTSAEPLRIGSVKTNIGHLEAASGAAGLIKAALMLDRGSLPPSLHFKDPNPRIDFERLRLKVQDRPEEWPAGAPGVIGVNSFGFGGTNAHVVLERAPAEAGAPHARGPSAYLVPLSARKPEALTALASALAQHLHRDEGVALRDVAYTLAERRSHSEERAALVASSLAELREQLEGLVTGSLPIGAALGTATTGRKPKVAFVLSGMGPQWWAMARQLLHEEPVFRRAFDECDALFRSLAGWSLADALIADETESRMEETEVAQPANFALQVGLAALLQSWGVRADGVVGHSAGEVAAAYLAGAMSLGDAVGVIYHRSRLQQRATGRGRMLAVGMSLAEAEALLGQETRVSIAANNAPHAVTLSGDADALETIASELQARGIFNRYLEVKVPYHSPAMEPLRADLLTSLARIRPQTPKIPLYSTVSGSLLDGNGVDSDYWWSNVRQPVRFAAAIEQMAADGYDVYIELGPHPVLSRSVQEVLAAAGNKGSVLPTLRRGEDERMALLRTAASLYTLGHTLDWIEINGRGRHQRLPTYPWQRERYWNESRRSARYRLGQRLHPLLERRLETAYPAWETMLDPARLPHLLDHRIQGTAIYPAAAYIEMAIAAARELHAEGAPVIEDIEFKRPLALPDREPIDLQFACESQDGSFEVHSRPRDAAAWSIHARGRLRAERIPPVGRRPSLARLQRLCTVPFEGDWYELFREMGLEYGPGFRGLTELWLGRRQALGRITLPATACDGETYGIHPAALDACFHVLLGAAFLAGAVAGGKTYVPVEVASVRLHKSANGDLWSHAKLSLASDAALKGDFLILDENGDLVAELRGFKCQAIEGRHSSEDLGANLYEMQWLARDLLVSGKTRDASYLPWPQDIVDSLSFDDSEFRAERQRYYAEIEAHNARLATGYILRAFARLGWRPTRGERFTTESFAATYEILPQYSRLLARLLEILSEDGILARGDYNSWTVLRKPRLVDMDAMRKTLGDQYPEYDTILTLFHRCGLNLADVLRGEVDPIQLVFPDGAMSDIAHVYRSSPYRQTYNAMLRKAFEFALSHLPAKRTIRILEVGAGTGGTTDHLLPLLPPNRTEYAFTDVSMMFAATAKRRLSKYPFVEYRYLDIGQDPEAQGYAPHTFDLVVAADVLHVTPDLRQTLANVRTLLASDGLLFLLEISRPSRFLDLVFGLLKDWWSFEDYDLRDSHPWLPLTAWLAVLRQAGFSSAAALREPAAPDDPSSSVIIARGPRVITQLIHQDAATNAASPPAGTLILAGRQGAGESIATNLARGGVAPVVVTPGAAFARTGHARYEVRTESAEDFAALLQDLAAADYPLGRVVHLWSLDAKASDTTKARRMASLIEDSCLSALALLQALGRAGSSESPRLHFVTRGVHVVGDDVAPVSIAQSALWGLGRVIMNEHPHVRAKLIDLDPATPEGEIDALLDELRADDDEPEVCLRANARFVPRMLRRAPREGPIRTDRRASTAAAPAYEVALARRGSLDSLHLREARRRPPGQGEIEIEVVAAGLNFRDVMKALGMYPPDDPNFSRFGDECAGRVVRVGKGVVGFAIGDEVVAVSTGTFRSHLTVPASSALHKPARLSFEQAATIPIVFLTAHYALDEVARLQPGERVLIHSAAGGVGLAAIQIARRAGAEIYATAGSPEKRAFLNSLGIKHVMDSRSLAFADEVMEITRGEGVDVVLNSLAGEFIPKGLSVLRPGGRFLELGKVDIYQNSRLGLWPFRGGLSFSAIDLGWTLAHKPALARDMLVELMSLFERGELEPLPVQTFTARQVADAFRFMSQARHTGKIALTFAAAEAIPVSPKRKHSPLFRADGAYLVTGGLGGFGLALARWLAQEGARNLVLVGRRGAASPEAEQTVAALRSAGVRVEVMRADVSRTKEVEALLAEVRSKLPPLRGIFHGAMVLADSYLLNMDREAFRKPLLPKAIGAWNLHRATHSDPLDHFVLFSSLASVGGSPGQGNYAAANAFLDGLAHYRRASGLPALTANWGAISDAGYVARSGDIASYLERQGLGGMRVADALTLLGQLLREGDTQAGVMRLDIDKVLSNYASPLSARRFEHLVGSPDEGAGKSDAGERGALLRTLRAAPKEQRLQLLEAFLCEQMAYVLQIPVTSLNPEQPLASIGLDSLMSVEFEVALETQVGVRLPLGFLLSEGLSIRSLAQRLLQDLSLEGRKHTATSKSSEPETTHANA